ncbi:hypothetical protein Leryth_007892 [Lithospermum erythrorhizon]|nr:hypothetical protein Leryth_007892 [Lithospermum erythrorhizon]
MEQNNLLLENKFFGVAMHSRVRKIKQEMEKINLRLLEQPEINRVLQEIPGRQQRSRSPLGLKPVIRPISVGN